MADQDGIPLTVFNAQQQRGASVDAERQQLVGDYVHGADRTRMSTSDWRTTVGGWGVAVIILLLLAAIFSILGFVASKKLSNSSTTGGSGLADKCSSTGVFSWASAKCKPIRQSDLPFVSTANGACHRLDEDLVWAGGIDEGYAIEWYGNRGELHFCGHNLTLTNQSGRGVLVHGSFGDDAGNAGGELTVYDGNMESSTQQYNALGRGFAVQFGGVLNLYDARAHNLYRGVSNSEATLYAVNANITNMLSLDDPNRALAWDDDLWADDAYGIICVGATACVAENYVYAASHDDASGDYRAVPYGLQSYGFFCTHNAGAADPRNGPGQCRLEGAIITASFGVVSLRAGASLISDLEAHVLGGVESQYDTTYWGPIANPINTPGSNNYGVRIGCGNTSNTVFRNSVINTHDVTEWSYWNQALRVSGSRGLVVENVVLVGSAPQPAFAYVGSVPLGDGYIYLNSAMVSVETDEDTENAGPLHITRLTVRNDDGADGIGMTVSTAFGSELYLPSCFGANVSAVIEHSSFSGDGGIGVLIGAQATHQLVISDTTFNGQYYGVYAYNNSKNVLLERNFYTQHCEAVHIEPAASKVILANSRYSDNSVDLVNLGAAVVDYSPLSTGETGAECGAAPEVRDVTQYTCNVLARRRSTTTSSSSVDDRLARKESMAALAGLP